MKKFALKKMVEVLLPCLATSVAFAEPPSPPPVQAQSGSTVRDGARTGPSTTPAAQAAVQTFPFDPLKIKPREDPFYTNMVGIPYGSFLLFPEISLTHGYDSNIYAERKNETSDWVTTLSPMLVAKSKWDQHILNFGMGVDIGSYMNHSSENVTDYWLSIGGQYDFSPESNVFGNLVHSHNHEDRGSADTDPALNLGLNPTQYDSTEASVGFARKDGPYSVRASLNSEKLDFSTPAGAVSPYNNDDRNRTQDSIVARVGYAVSPTLEPFIQAETDTRRYDKRLDDYGFMRSSDGYRVALGAVFKPSANMQGEAYIGQMYQQFDDSRFADVNQPYFGGDLSWKPRPGTTATAFLERTLEETTVAGASSSVDTTMGAKVEKVLSQNMLVNGRMAYTWSDFKGGRNDETLDAGAGLKYYVTPTVFLGADYRYVNRDSNVSYANYFRNQAMFSVGYTPGRKSINPDGSTGGGWLDSLGEGMEGVLHASITPKLYAFDNSSGFRNDRVGFLERYDYREDSFSDGHQRDGLIADVDLAVVYADSKRDVLVLERDGFGINNQRTNLKADSDAVKFKAYNNIFTTATGGIDYRFNPNQVAGGTDPNYNTGPGESQHVAYFTFDSPDTLYSVKRNSNGASLEFKPAVFDGNGAVVVSYDGYTRNGNRVANYELPKILIDGSLAESNQWRGYSQPIDERNNRFAVNLSLTPGDLFNLNYELAVDKFQSSASTFTLDTLSQLKGIPLGGGGGADPHFNNTWASLAMPLNFVADSTLTTNNLRFSKQLGKTAVLAAGYSTSSLKQDSFTDIQTANGYTDGKTDTDSAYVTGKFNLSESVGLEAFYRYNKRENNSTYPAGNFINPIYGSASSSSYERMVMPRINKIETDTYGLEATLYPQFLKTSLSAGWKHEDKDRDFTYGIDGSVTPLITLSGAQSSSDEVYLKLVSRPAQGWTIRLTPSYLWADKTGLVSEPEEAIQVKTLVSYAKPEWHELFVSGYYNYKQTENGLLGFANYNVIGAPGGVVPGSAGNLQPGAFGTGQAQKMNNTMQSAGLNLNMVPSEALKLNLGYDWNQTDFSTYYFTSNRIRFHYLNVPQSNRLTSLDFLILDNPSYKVDTQTVSAGGEWQGNKYTLSGQYSYNWSKGHNADGLGGQSLPAADASVNNVLQTLSFGINYALKSNLSLKGSYTFDNYKDHVYNELSGDLHTIMVGLNYRM